MHPIQHHRKRRRIIQQPLKMLDRLLLRHLQAELAEHLLVHVALLDVRDVCVRHERDEVENEVRALAEDGEGGEAVLFEARVVHRLDTAHGVDHLLADLDGRSEWFGVTSEDVAKID